jgi:pimeloyl-ACP methyl ester carboxylesterase
LTRVLTLIVAPHFRTIRFDQRGCGQSTPSGRL